MTRVSPLHEVVDWDKAERLAYDMAARGWVGRPVLVDDATSDEPRAITGTHRIEAASMADIPVEIYGLENTRTDIDALFRDCEDDEDMLEAIEDGGDERAIEIMADELAGD